MKHIFCESSCKVTRTFAGLAQKIGSLINPDSTLSEHKPWFDFEKIPGQRNASDFGVRITHELFFDGRKLILNLTNKIVSRHCPFGNFAFIVRREKDIYHTAGETLCRKKSTKMRK